MYIETMHITTWADQDEHETVANGSTRDSNGMSVTKKRRLS